MTRLHEFLRNDGFKSPTSLTNNPYTFGHDTKGKDVWEHIDSDPDRARTFNYAMEAQTQASLPTVGIYPFESELAKLVEGDDNVVLVDVGGGKGQASKMIRQGCPGLKGRFVLQDRPEVIANITNELPGIEKMSHDFFEEQPVKGSQSASNPLQITTSTSSPSLKCGTNSNPVQEPLLTISVGSSMIGMTSTFAKYCVGLQKR